MGISALAAPLWDNLDLNFWPIRELFSLLGAENSSFLLIPFEHAALSSQNLGARKERAERDASFEAGLLSCSGMQYSTRSFHNSQIVPTALLTLCREPASQSHPCSCGLLHLLHFMFLKQNHKIVLPILLEEKFVSFASLCLFYYKRACRKVI